MHPVRHKTIQKDVRNLEAADVGSRPVDLVFFDVGRPPISTVAFLLVQVQLPICAYKLEACLGKPTLAHRLNWTVHPTQAHVLDAQMAMCARAWLEWQGNLSRDQRGLC